MWFWYLCRGRWSLANEIGPRASIPGCFLTLAFRILENAMGEALHITIATRQSRLALWQAEHVQSRLQALGHSVKLLGMTTLGDQILDRSLSKVGGKGLFVKELELALEDGRADLAVHSLKDVPMALPDGFELACVLAREDARDAFVSPRYASLKALPEGAVLGTSSLRRAALVRALRPDLRIEPLRGNLDTRLRKLDSGAYDAIVLASAGLKRLGLTSRIRQEFDVQEMLPAAGQGALGVEIRADRAELRELLLALADSEAWLRVTAERAVSRLMGGSCSMPLAAHARLEGQSMTLEAAWGDVHGQLPLVRVSRKALVQSRHDADQLGRSLAADLRRAILANGGHIEPPQTP